jgi:GDP-L-fucose synthase
MTISKTSKIYVAGHRGMVGSALMRVLQAKGYSNIITRTRQELDLLNQEPVYKFLQDEKPEYIFIATAKVGGILANSTYKADFIFQNLQIEANLIHGAHLAGVQRLMFLGSSCIYPRDCPQPIKEEYLLTGPLEPTNESYAVAKIAGIKLCEAYNFQHGRQYISVMPTNLYGINDNYDLENSHVLPALIRKAHEAKTRGDSSLTIWGTGTPHREFLFSNDLAEACVFLMEQNYFGSIINIGTGEEISIKALAEKICEAVGFNGTLKFDTGKPDGTPRKVLHVEKIHDLGWHHSTPLETGIKSAYADFINAERTLS